MTFFCEDIHQSWCDPSLAWENKLSLASFFEILLLKLFLGEPWLQDGNLLPFQKYNSVINYWWTLCKSGIRHTGHIMSCENSFLMVIYFDLLILDQLKFLEILRMYFDMYQMQRFLIMFISNIRVLPAKSLWFFYVTLQQPLFDIGLLW